MINKLELCLDITPFPTAATHNLSAALEAQDLLAVNKRTSNKFADLKVIPTSQLKLDNGDGVNNTKPRIALPDLSAEDLKEMADRVPLAMKTCKQISDLLSKSTLGDDDKNHLQCFAEKLTSDIKLLYDRSHNCERPLVTDQLSANSDGVNESLDKSWQQLKIISQQSRGINEKLYPLLHSQAIARTNNEAAKADLSKLMAQFSSSIDKLAYPLSNLRTNIFTKEEQEQYEATKKLREGYFKYGLSAEELRPFHDQYDPLKPYFAMVDAYREACVDLTSLTVSAYSKPCEDELLKTIGLKATGNMDSATNLLHEETSETKARLQQNLDKFITLFDDPKVTALETDSNIKPFIREQMLLFRKRGRMSIKGFYHLRSFLPTCNPETQARKLSDMCDYSNMCTAADELWSFEDALKSKLTRGARSNTYTKIDDIK